MSVAWLYADNPGGCSVHTAVGVIQFQLLSTSVSVKEEAGMASLVIIRGPGTYGDVAVTYNATSSKLTS